VRVALSVLWRVFSSLQIHSPFPVPAVAVCTPQVIFENCANIVVFSYPFNRRFPLI